MSLCYWRRQICIFKRVILSCCLPVFCCWLFYCSKYSCRTVLTCVCSLILAFSSREEGVIIFFISAISPFCVSYFTVHNHLRVFVSYFIERCSFAILLRKKKKLIHANMSIYTCCVLLYHSPVLHNTEMIPRQNFSKDKNLRKFKLVYKFSQRL